MNQAEINYGKALGKQIDKSKNLFCPLCCEDLSATPKKDGQYLSSCGDYEHELFCPHCDASITLTVDLGKNKNNEWVKAVLVGD